MKKIINIIIIFVVLTFLYFFNGRNQEGINWEFYIDKQTGANSVLNIGRNLTFDNDFIYFSDGAGTIYSILQKDGSINWTSKLANHTPFEITQDDTSIYIASFDKHIYKLDKSNGYIEWSYVIESQYWPDTEVILDENDKYVFFADRGGNLYALDKNSGNEVWRKEFQAMDNTVEFKEGSIHFGFMTQNEDELIVDHFPSKTIYRVNKTDGLILEESEPSLDFKPVKTKENLFFDQDDLDIKRNVANQPALSLFDKDDNLIWVYQTKRKINFNEIYQYKNRAYFLDINNQILSSIIISSDPLEEEKIVQTNFKVEENFSSHGPFNVYPNPHIRFEKESSITEVIKQKIKGISNYFMYILDNFKELFDFKINTEEKYDYTEFSILHQDNFYNNKFTEVKINGEFENKLTNEKLKISGFYYDKNTWKLRAKLNEGEWIYNIKVITPFWIKKFKGSLQVNKEKEPELLVKNGEFVVGENLFLPLGLQDAIVDLSDDGNRLNMMGHAFSNKPLEDNYEYLPFEDYLDLYKNESSMNIFRYGPDNWAPSIWKNLNDSEQFEMDINGNYEGDFITQEAKKRGYRVMMSVFAFYPPYSSKEEFSKKSNRLVLEKYLDYVVARYGASVDIWELANEAIPTLEWQKFISDYLINNDPYKHPITINLEDSRLDNSDLLSIHYVAEEPLDNKNFVYMIENFNTKHDQDMTKIISEFGFIKANHFPGSAEWLRKFAWAFSFQKIGIIFWNTGFGYFENIENQNSNIYLGPEERFYLKNLRNFLPDMSADSISKLYFENENKIAVFSLSDNNFNLYYLLNLDQSDKSQVFEVDATSSGVGTFVNPKTGNKLQEFPVKEGKQQLSLPDFNDDLAIKISYD